MQNNKTTLFKGKTNKLYIIEKINIPNSDFTKHIFNQGIYDGEKIVILSKIAGGIVLNVKDSRIFLEEDAAKLIDVIPSNKTLMKSRKER